MVQDHGPESPQGNPPPPPQDKPQREVRAPVPESVYKHEVIIDPKRRVPEPSESDPNIVYLMGVYKNKLVRFACPAAYATHPSFAGKEVVAIAKETVKVDEREVVRLHADRRNIDYVGTQMGDTLVLPPSIDETDGTIKLSQNAEERHRELAAINKASVDHMMRVIDEDRRQERAIQEINIDFAMSDFKDSAVKLAELSNDSLFGLTERTTRVDIESNFKQLAQGLNNIDDPDLKEDSPVIPELKRATAFNLAYLTDRFNRFMEQRKIYRAPMVGEQNILIYIKPLVNATYSLARLSNEALFGYEKGISEGQLRQQAQARIQGVTTIDLSHLVLTPDQKKEIKAALKLTGASYLADRYKRYVSDLKKANLLGPEKPTSP
jgi:hypothetical protein